MQTEANPVYTVIHIHPVTFVCTKTTHTTFMHDVLCQSMYIQKKTHTHTCTPQ